MKNLPVFYLILTSGTFFKLKKNFDKIKDFDDDLRDKTFSLCTRMDFVGQEEPHAKKRRLPSRRSFLRKLHNFAVCGPKKYRRSELKTCDRYAQELIVTVPALVRVAAKLKPCWESEEVPNMKHPDTSKMMTDKQC